MLPSCFATLRVSWKEGNRLMPTFPSYLVIFFFNYRPVYLGLQISFSERVVDDVNETQEKWPRLGVIVDATYLYTVL